MSTIILSLQLLFVLDGLYIEVLDEAFWHRGEDGHGSVSYTHLDVYKRQAPALAAASSKTVASFRADSASVAKSGIIS